MDNFSILLRGMIDPDSKQTIEQQIAQLSQTIKESIKVKITIDTEQFKEISRQIQNIQQYVPQQNISLGMQDTNSTLDKTILKFKILNDGQQKLLSQTIEWTDELGQAVKEAVKFDQETGAPIDRIKELTDNTKKHREEQQKISDIISTQLEKIQSRAKILKQTNWTADFRDLDNFTQNLDPSKISFDNYKKQLNDISLKYNEIASNIRESHNNNLSNLQKEIKLEDQKQSSTMRNWVQTLEADEKLRKIESDRIKQQMQLNSQREKETQQLEQQLALFKQKMLGGDGITGQIDILKDKFGKNIDSTALDNIKQQIESLTTSTPNLNYEMKRLSSNITNIKQAAMQSGNVMTRMFENMVKFLRFYLVGGFVVKIRDTFTEGIKVVKELDTALVELAKVSDVTGRELEKFTDQAYEIGTRLGRTGKEVINATAEFARAGYNLQEAATLGEQALLLTNIGDGIDNVRDASSSLIAILKGFKMEAEDTIHVVDALNEVSNKFAIDTDNLTKILIRVSGTIAQTGTSYEELIGLATAGYESLRNAEKVASGINMISQRLRGMNSEGEKVDDLIPKIQAVFDKYTPGVSVIDKVNGGLHSTYEILEQLSKVYPTLTDEAKAYINEAVAGNRQNTVLVSIMENFKAVQDASETAMNSMGSAVRENEKYLDSIQGKTAQFSSSVEKMWCNTIDSNTIKSIVDLGTGIISLIDKFGLLQTALLATITYFTVFKTSMAIVPIINVATIAISRLTAGLNLSTAAAIKLNTVSGMIAPIAIAGAVMGLVKAIDYLNVTVEEQTQKVEKLSEEYENLKSKISSLESELETTAKRIDELNSKDKLSIIEKDELEKLRLTNKELQARIDLLNKQTEITNKKLGREALELYNKITPAYSRENIEQVKQTELPWQVIYDQGFNKDTQNINILIAAYEELVRLKKESTDSEDITKYSDLLTDVEDKIVEQNSSLADVREILRLLPNPTEKQKKAIDEINESLTRTQSLLDPEKLFTNTWDSLTEEQQKYISTLSKNGQLTEEQIKEYADLFYLIKYGGFTFEDLKKSIDSVNTTQEEISDNSDTPFKSVIEDVEKYKETIDDLNKQISFSINTIQSLNTAIQELSTKEGLSAKSLEDIRTNYPDLIMYLDDEKRLKTELNKILENETKSQKQLFKSKLELSTQYFNQMIKGNVNLWNAISQYYNVDAKNFQTVADVKKKINDELVAYIGESWSKLYGSEIEALNSIEQGLVTGLSQVHDEATKRQMIQQLEDVRKKKEILEGINKPLESTVNKIDFDKLNISKDNKSSSSKTTDLINVEIDRFSNLQQAIDDTNNKIEIYKQLISFTDDLKKRNEYENELIKLYDEQKKQIHEITDAQRNAIKENINTLKGYGFDIEYDPTANRLRIKNEEQINKIYGKNNEETNELRKNIEEIIKETKEWNKVNQENGREWQDLNNQIREINQAKLDYVKDTEKEIARIIKDSVDSEKKALDDKLKKYKDTVDERKRLLDEEYSEEEYLRNLRKEEEKAAEIARKIENQKLDNSHDSYQKTLELEKELAEQEERIWEMKSRKSYEDQVKNLDLQYEAQEKYVENRKSSLDKEFNDERINLMAQQALINGFYTDIHGNTVSFKDNFSSLMKELGVAIEDNFITQLEYAKILINELNNIDTSKIGEMIQLRSYYESLGKKVDWQNGNVLVDGKAIDLSGLENINGRFYGTKDVLDQKIGLGNSSSNTLTSMKTLLQNSLTALKGIGLSSILPPEATVNNRSVGDIIVNVQTSEVNKNNASDVGNTISNSILKKIRDGILTGRS